MKIIAALLTLILMSGCSIYAEVGVGKNDKFYNLGTEADNWIGSDDVGAYLGIEARRSLSERVDGMCYYKHFSQWVRGWPVDKRDEDWLDTFGCGVSVRIFGDK